MIENYVFRDAPDAFQKSMIDFVDQHIYGSFVHDDLLGIFQQVSHTNVSKNI